MSNSKTLIAVTVIAAFSLAACESAQNAPKQTGGAVLGGIGGGLAGAQFGKGKGQLAAVALGALAGAFIGSEVGSSLDKADRMYQQKAEGQSHSAPVGKKISWANPESGNSGSYTNLREGRDETGSNCKEYEQTVTVNGKTETAVGTACQQSDGTWKMLK